MRQTRTMYYPLGGGLDTVSPALSVDPGHALAMVNYEPYFNGGYRRVDGYERYDGRPKPSDATFVAFTVNTISGLSLGANVLDTISGATGVIVGIDPDTVTIGVTKVNGTFGNGHALSGGQVITSVPGLNDAPTSTLEDEWTLNAQDEYRDDIQPVPGSGEVRGVWQRDENVYAIRDDVDSPAQGRLWLATSTGWTTNGIIMARYIFFVTGGGGSAQALPTEGTTINGQTSGATGVVHRVVEHGGATGTNDAYGYIVLRNVTGSFLTGENLRVVTTKFAASSTASRLFTFPLGGHYRFINKNFLAGAETFRTYGVSGAGPAFEIDENNVVSPILLPSSVMDGQPASNTPFLIEEHQNYLWLAFEGGTFANSVVGEPMVFNGFLGAAEFGMGAEITGLNSIVGNVLVISANRITRGLYGSGPSDWELKLIGERMGAKLYTAQKLDTVYALDDMGVTNFSRTQTFGDFAGAVVSQLIQPIISALRSKVTDSTIVKATNQYRLYFNDNSALIMYVPLPGQQNRSNSDQAAVQFGYVQYPTSVLKAYNSDDENNEEVSYFLSDDGYVYQDRIGTSFDGEDIPSYIRLAFNNVKSPAYRKFFRRADLELSSTRELALKFVSDLSYGSPEVSSSVADLTASDITALNVFAGGGFFDTGDWDTFLWDAQDISNARAYLSGSGENIGFLIFNESAIAPPFVLQGITLHYELRRLQR